MKRLFLLSLVFVFASSFMLYAQTEANDDDDYVLKGRKVKELPFYVYTDSFHRMNHFIPSGWMGD
ncbi:MAG: hypothetical protein KKH98_06000, partial [Spirochaetes bacterium]|nr:hypothetical protein [Spirochaetota bacterium]